MQTNASPYRTGTGAIAAALCAPLVSMLMSGCGASNPAGSPQAGTVGPVHYIVTADTTSFYKLGPAQPGGPDLRLKKDQIVTLVEKRYGYSRIIDQDGDAGYVPTEDIAPAPNQPPVLASSPRKSRGGSQSAPVDYYGDQPNDAPLPSKQPPSDQPAPSFRY